MLSWKRMLYVILMVTVISCIFMLYNINEERARHINITNVQVESKNFTDIRPIETAEKPFVWIVGEDAEDGGNFQAEIAANVKQIFRNLHYVLNEVTDLEPEKLGKNDLVVFCDDSVGTHTDLIKLEAFLSGGGKIILAAGLPEGNRDSYLWPILGIREKSIRENYNRLHFEEPLFPIQEEEMDYEGYNMSTRLSVDENAKVYIRDADSGVPLLYVRTYGEGAICLLNGTFLSDIRCAGLLTGAVGTLQEDFCYPVLGTKTVFLDNFPMITFINDKVCMRMYGCSTESFVRDVVWPNLQGMSLRTQTPYTSSVLGVASSEESFPGINDSLFTAIGKSALQFGGELVYAANCTDKESIVFHHAFIEKFDSIFTNYKIQGLVMQTDSFQEEMMDIPNAKIKAVRMNLRGENAGFSCNDRYLTFPAATYGNSLEEGNLFYIASVLGAYGMISHVFDINTLIAENEETASWDSDKKQIGLFETEVLKQTAWLEGCVLSQMKDDVKSWLNLEYSWKRKGNTIILDGSNMVMGQAFFLRTQGEILGAEGADYKKAGNGYYLLRMQQNHAVITMDNETTQNHK